VSLLDATHIGELVAMIGVAAVSARVFLVSISDGDAVFAWIWAVLFMVASFIVAWVFWRVI
jgi:hypothetical protein